ncbi:phosphotransferase [Allostreptomyces psammosilenae]|uniref:Aminoglycoside phosphotransferase n=1 Tax=Allostreptomyces psammosilenae TaxID=1892865 RepID=A0A852ZVR1_9ACTN|nr:phosphotransferase [Allostreptomyces psammosilenae]NYI05340.1 aminoglycoside phosphotransferase [Allostreptomyces psammosilenae]
MEEASVRPGWETLPRAVRLWVQEQAGTQVLEARTTAGGLTSGVATLASMADGQRLFIKAAREDDDTAELCRAEARAASALPVAVPAPRLRRHAEMDGWTVLVFDAVDGRHPSLAPSSLDLPVVLSTVAGLSDLLTPCPLQQAPAVGDDLAADFTGWQHIASTPPSDLDPWAQRHLEQLVELEQQSLLALDGSTMLHTDLRADNLLVSGDQAWIVDWSWAVRGAAWLDAAFLLPQLVLAGHTAASAETAMRAIPAWREADSTAITAFAAGLTGLWEAGSRNPTSPSALRAYRRRAAAAGRAWLRHRNPVWGGRRALTGRWR